MTELPPSSKQSESGGAMDVHVDSERAPAPAPARNQLRGPRRQIVIVFGIAATIVISLLAITLLYFKWYKTEEFNVIIVVWGQEDWDGATVEVTGLGIPEGLSARLRAKSGMTQRFHVPAGSYVVTVRRGERILGQSATPKPLAARNLWWPFRAPPKQPVVEDPQ